jgi:alpha-D-xyloside xylohydrolase
MPYIFRKAIQSRETGIPVMRSMILEFEKDPAVKYLDMQYMIGESLLVAPIFKEDGEVDYYLPAGTWTHLLSGEIREGGRWYHEKYDYFSLPLYVRENTLLALGANDQLPDYDYKNGVTLHLYQLKEGNEAVCEIPDIQGEIVLTAKARSVGRTITLTADVLSENMSYVLHGITEVKEVKGASFEMVKEGVKMIPDKNEVVVEL